MKNKKQITVLATVAVTIEYDVTCGLDEEMIMLEVENQLKATICNSGIVEWFGEQADPVRAVVRETSVVGNTYLPTAYKY